MERRAFLAATAASLGSLATPSRAWSGLRTAQPIGVQLYTVRELLNEDFRGTMEQVARIGFREVEFAGYHGHEPREVRGILDALGLAAPGNHLPFESLDEGWERELSRANDVGHRYVVIAWIPPARRETLDDWRRLADRFNRAAREAKAAGLRFAYHNHDAEFVRQAGVVPFDILLERTDPELVKIELDLYWITKGGADPLDYFTRWPGRFPLVHVKDSLGSPGHRQTDVGDGVIDWQRIFQARSRAGMAHYFVEHDDPAHPLDSIARSYRYLAGLGL